MPSDANSRAIKLQSSYRKLSYAADALNQASDEFGQAIEILDSKLADLKIGVTGWITFSKSHSEYDETQATEERIGYDKIGTRKGLAISVVNVDHAADEENLKQQWLFNEAPRSIRIRAIDSVPELLEHLAKEAASTAERVKESAQVAAELAAAIGAPNKGGLR